jgi:hypothetical protein
MFVRYFLLLLFTFYFRNISVSQKGFEEGIVITNKNDTIRAFIKDRSYGSNGQRLNKIKVKNDRLLVKRYSPYDIKSYSIGNDFYESFWLNPSYKGLKEVIISERNVGKKHFLKLVIRGEVSLYYWEIRDYESDTFDYIELIKRTNQSEFIRASQGVFGLKSKRLIDYFDDCPKLVEKIISKELKTAYDVVNFYNRNCISKH